MPITVKTLEALSRTPGKWVSERIWHRHGSLTFRSLADGEIAIYFRYQDEDQRPAIDLGRFGVDGSRGKMTLPEARTRAGELAQMHAQGIVALREYLAAEARKQNEALRAAKEGTFDELLRSYCGLLKAELKESAGEATALLDKWVRQPFPYLLELKAGEVTHSEIMDILENVAETMKIRTLNKVRSYLLAAFNRAIKANGNALDAVRMGRASSKYGITINPVASTVRVQGFDNVNVGSKLETGQIRYIWPALETYPMEEKDFLRINLRLGGQRVRQLLRVKGGDVDLAKGEIVLWDPKGRRRKARMHKLPIPLQARAMLTELIEMNGEGYLFSRDGKKPLDASRMSEIAREISRAQKLVNPKELGFSPRDFRTTAESRMAEMGVPEKTRGLLLSHGLGGVQDTHYDQADYLPQLSDALEKWNEWIDEILFDQSRAGDNVVVPFRRRISA